MLVFLLLVIVFWFLMNEVCLWCLSELESGFGFLMLMFVGVGCYCFLVVILLLCVFFFDWVCLIFDFEVVFRLWGV